MDLFRLIGTIFVNNNDANNAIKETTEQASSMASSLSGRLKDIASTIGSVGASLLPVTAAITAAGGAMVAVANNTAGVTDNIDKMSQKLGLSRTAYQEWDYILSQNGASIDSMKMGMRTLNNTIDSVTQTGTTAGTAFERLGISFDDLKGKSQEEIFEMTIKALQNCTNETERTKLANELLGRSGMEMAPLLNSGADSVDKLRRRAHELGLVLDDETVDAGVEMTDAMDTMRRAFTALGATIAMAAMPMIKDFCYFIAGALPTVRAVVEGFVNAWNAIPEPIRWAIIAILGIVAAIGPVLIAISGVISAIGTVIGALSTIISILPVVGAAVGALVTFITGPVGIVIAVIAALVAAFIWLWNNCEGFRNFWIALWNGIVEMVSLAWGLIVEIFQTIWPVIQPIVQAGLDWMLNIWRTYFEGMFNVLSVIFNTMAEFIKQGVENFRTIIQIITALIHGDWKGAWEGVQRLTEGIFKSIGILIQGAMDLVLAIIQAILNNILATWGLTWDSALALVQNIFNSIVNAISNAMNSVLGTINGIIGNIQNSFNGLLNSAQNAVWGLVSAFNGIQGQFYSIMNSIQSAVYGAANSLANAFNFSWQLPYIPLPHFWIAGSFSLDPPQVPNFGIDWYDKAMNQPYVFEDPTLFGFNPVTGAARVAGETGDEMMYGRQNLMNDIEQAVATQNSGVVNAINNSFARLFDILAEYFPEFANTQLVLDTGVLVAETADQMDEQLGLFYKRRGRQ